MTIRFYRRRNSAIILPWLVIGVNIVWMIWEEQIPEKYVPVIEALRSWRGMGLKEAKFLCQYAKENCLCVLLAGVDLDPAEDLKKKLQKAGVTASVQTSTLQNPMIVYPSADKHYEFHWFFGPRRRTL